LSIGNSNSISGRNFKVHWDGTLYASNGHFDGIIESSVIKGGIIKGTLIEGSTVIGSKIIGPRLIVPTLDSDIGRGLQFYTATEKDVIDEKFPTSKNKKIGNVGLILGSSTGQNITYNIGMSSNNTSIILESEKNIKMTAKESNYIYAENEVGLNIINDYNSANPKFQGSFRLYRENGKSFLQTDIPAN
jgi:hypothetical protein